MFDAHPFHAWPLVLAGASLFAGLFGLLAVVEEALFGGVARMTPQVWWFAATAFVGFLLAAAVVRHRHPPEA